MLDEERIDILPTNSRGESFEPDELFVYVNGNKFELGKVKRVNNDNTGYFCWYHSGDTSANTSVEDMHKLINNYCVEKTMLGGESSDGVGA